MRLSRRQLQISTSVRKELRLGNAPANGEPCFAFMSIAAFDNAFEKASLNVAEPIVASGGKSNAAAEPRVESDAIDANDESEASDPRGESVKFSMPLAIESVHADFSDRGVQIEKVEITVAIESVDADFSDRG